MQLAVIHALAAGWLLTCFARFISGSPQRPYWIMPVAGVPVTNPEIGNRFPLQIDHGYGSHGSLNSPYESIDRFQIEQRRQPQNRPGQSQLRYDYEDEYSDQFRNDQESYYQNLLRVTENPLTKLENHATFLSAHEPQTHYQDYLPLDENESLNAKKNNSKETHGSENPKKAPSTINEKVKNSTDHEIALLMTKLLMKDSYVPSLNDLDALNSLEDEMIAESTVPDEIKRGVRQVRGQQPGFLWTLARLAFEKVNDTKSAVNQIGTIVSNNLSPEGIPTPSPTTTTTTTTTASSLDTDAGVSSNGTTMAPTTTEAPFILTRTVLQGIIRRNVKGLIRLFKIEWRDAVNQSQVSARDFQRDLGNQIRPYLEDNPNVNL